MPRYIDADRLMRDIRQRAYLTDNIVERPIYAMTLLGIQQTVDEQPTVSPDEVRVVGMWIKLDAHKGMEQYKCSACNTPVYVPECMEEPMYSFCPVCGARMEVEGDA